MYNAWRKEGRGGSYNGYYKLRNPTNKSSSAQRAQRQKFRNAALSCKGKSKSEFLSCMSQKL